MAGGRADAGQLRGVVRPEWLGWGHWRAGRDTSTWEGWLDSQLVWAASEPWTFLFYTLLLLSPCLLASAGLSWRLSQQIEKQQRRRKERKKE